MNSVMKSLLRYVCLLGLVTLSLSLTGCGRQQSIDVNLTNGSEVAISTDYFTLTNQEVFELVAGGYIDWVNPGVTVILDWVDYHLLPTLVEIDETVIEEDMTFILENFDEDEIAEIIALEGFDSLEAYMSTLRLAMLRDAAVEAEIVVDENQVQEMYDFFFGTTDDEETDESDEDVEDEDEEEGHTTEELLEMIEDSIRDEFRADPTFRQTTLARLRAEAGFTIYSDYFGSRYESFLTGWLVEDVDVTTGNTGTNIASVNGLNFTTDEFFNTVLSRFGVAENSALLNRLDFLLLNELYDVASSDVRDSVSQAKVHFLDQFYPMMESQGLLTEQQIFDAFLLAHLHELAMDDHLNEVSEERIQALFEANIESLEIVFEMQNTPERSARHILIRIDDETDADEARAIAQGLIDQLQAVPANDVEDLFIELANTYSADGDGESGGDLGSFGRHRMVPAFDETVFNVLGLNEFTTEPIFNDVHMGYHVIFVYDIAESADELPELELPTLEDMRESLIANELNRMRENPRYFAHSMFGIREDANIRINLEFLRTQYETLQNVHQRMVEED